VTADVIVAVGYQEHGVALRIVVEARLWIRFPRVPGIDAE
jgi:hypothetical protein